MARMAAGCILTRHFLLLPQVHVMGGPLLGIQSEHRQKI